MYCKHGKRYCIECICEGLMAENKALRKGIVEAVYLVDCLGRKVGSWELSEHETYMMQIEWLDKWGRERKSPQVGDPNQTEASPHAEPMKEKEENENH